MPLTTDIASRRSNRRDTLRDSRASPSTLYERERTRAHARAAFYRRERARDLYLAYRRGRARLTSGIRIYRHIARVDIYYGRRS